MATTDARQMWLVWEIRIKVQCENEMLKNSQKTWELNIVAAAASQPYFTGTNCCHGIYPSPQESMEIELEAEKETILQKASEEKEEMSTQFEREQESLREELANSQRDRDESLLIAENDKQQVKEINISSHCPPSGIYVATSGQCRKSQPQDNLWEWFKLGVLNILCPRKPLRGILEMNSNSVPSSLWVLPDMRSFQQSLSMAETEKNQLLEKLNNAQRELANASMEMDRVKRETFSKAEQDKVLHF